MIRSTSPLVCPAGTSTPTFVPQPRHSERTNHCSEPSSQARSSIPCVCIQRPQPQVSILLSNFPGVEDVQHGVGRRARHKKNAVDDHRKSTERPMALSAIRPDTLDPHLNGKHDRDESKESDPHDEPPHTETI